MLDLDRERMLDMIAACEYVGVPTRNHEERRLYTSILNKCRSFNSDQKDKRKAARRTAHAQVSSRQIIEPIGPNKDAVGALLNGLSVDLTITDEKSMTIAVIEHHGSGHFGSDESKFDEIAMRDLIKETALRSAGIPLFVTKSESDYVEKLLDALDNGFNNKQLVKLKPIFDIDPDMPF